jgi:hypothetical protein
MMSQVCLVVGTYNFHEDVVANLKYANQRLSSFACQEQQQQQIRKQSILPKNTQSCKVMRMEASQDLFTSHKWLIILESTIFVLFKFSVGGHQPSASFISEFKDYSDLSWIYCIDELESSTCFLGYLRMS